MSGVDIVKCVVCGKDMPDDDAVDIVYDPDDPPRQYCPSCAANHVAYPEWMMKYCDQQRRAKEQLREGTGVGL
jgi:hypothetical protein